MRLMIINPDYGMTRAQMDARLAKLSAHVGPDVSLEMECLTRTQVTLDSQLEAALAGPEIISMAVDAQRRGCDGVVLYCFSDPAVDACREALDIPVIGGGQAACLAALTVARQAGVIVSSAARIPEKRMFSLQAGIDPARICGFAAPAGGAAFEDEADMIARLADCGAGMIAEQGVQALILGCLSFLGMAGPVSDALGVPVIDSALAAVTLAEALVRMGLKTSKGAYPKPAAMKRYQDAGALL